LPLIFAAVSSISLVRGLVTRYGPRFCRAYQPLISYMEKHSAASNAKDAAENRHAIFFLLK
jgi:hypothetical protein